MDSYAVDLIKSVFTISKDEAFEQLSKARLFLSKVEEYIKTKLPLDE